MLLLPWGSPFFIICPWHLPQSEVTLQWHLPQSEALFLYLLDYCLIPSLCQDGKLHICLIDSCVASASSHSARQGGVLYEYSLAEGMDNICESDHILGAGKMLYSFLYYKWVFAKLGC